jgi:clan AA aspartic protease (TIGR02281 family)
MGASGSSFVKRCIFATVAAAIGLALAGNAAAETGKCKVARIAEWPLRTGYYRPAFDGAINGQKIGILIDTGADVSLVQRSAATRLGLTRYRARGRFFGIGGETYAETVHIDEFRIGEGVRKNWQVLVAGEGSFSDDVAVLLGDDFFQQVDLEFDLAHNAVRLYETRDCDGVSLAYWATEPAGEVPIEAGSSIRLTVAINGKPVRAQLDSGVGYSMLSKADAARLGVTPESPGVVAAGCVRGLGEKQTDSWFGQFESFAIGNETIRNPRIRFADMWQHVTYTKTGSRLPSPVAGLPDLLLGADFLRAHRVLVARSQRKMYFTYAGGTVFPSVPSKSCNEPPASDPGPDPVPKQGKP